MSGRGWIGFGIPSKNLQFERKVAKCVLKCSRVHHLKCRDLVTRLLAVDPSKRLGSKTIEEIKRHQWYEWCDWSELYEKGINPPLVPTIYHDGDIGEETGTCGTNQDG